MKKTMYVAAMACVMAFGVQSCRDTEKETKTEAEQAVEEMQNEGADIDVSEDGDKIKMETDDKEVKIKTDDEGNTKIKVDDNS